MRSEEFLEKLQALKPGLETNFTIFEQDADNEIGKILFEKLPNILKEKIITKVNLHLANDFFKKKDPTHVIDNLKSFLNNLIKGGVKHIHITITCYMHDSVLKQLENNITFINLSSTRIKIKGVYIPNPFAYKNAQLPIVYQNQPQEKRTLKQKQSNLANNKQPRRPQTLNFSSDLLSRLGGTLLSITPNTIHSTSASSSDSVASPSEPADSPIPSESIETSDTLPALPKSSLPKKGSPEQRRYLHAMQMGNSQMFSSQKFSRQNSFYGLPGIGQIISTPVATSQCRVGQEEDDKDFAPTQTP